MTSPQAAAMTAGRPAPWLCLTERINIYSFILWAVALAITLLRARLDDLELEDKEGIAQPGAMSFSE